MRSLRRIRAGAAVFNGHLDRPAFDRTAKHQASPTIWRSRLYGISQQAREGIAELAGVSVDRQSLRLQRHFDAHAPLPRQFIQARGYFA